MFCVDSLLLMSKKFKWRHDNQLLYLDVEDYVNESMMKGPDGVWKCSVCDYSAKHTGHVRHHIESKHMSLEYSCYFCSKTCPTKVALSMHMHRKHKN